jgi:hypothetical protein
LSVVHLIFDIFLSFGCLLLRYKKREEELYKELSELQECEYEIVQEQGGQLATLQDQLDCAVNQNSEVLASGLTLDEKLALALKEKVELQQKLEESSSSQEQVGLVSQSLHWLDVYMFFMSCMYISW